MATTARRGRQAVAAIAAVMAAALLAGCGGSDDGRDPGGSGSRAGKGGTGGGSDGGGGSDPWGDGGRPAAGGRTVGAPGSPCALPLSFSTARDWKPESVPRGTHSQGTVEVACEIDAKPAGSIGFLRVWTGRGDSARGALTAFVADGDPQRRRYRTTEAGDGVEVHEVSYIERVVLDGEELSRKPVLAFAARSGDGRITVVELGGLDADEHEAMRPAYLLAKQTLKVRG